MSFTGLSPQIERQIAELSRLLAPQRGALDGNPYAHMIQGVVIGIHLGGLDIQLRGQVNPVENVRYLKSYVPAWSDNVWCIRFGSDLICIGTLEMRPAATTTPLIEDWHYVGDPGEPAFQNSWAHIGSTYERPRFALQSDGWVRVEGVVTGGTNGTVIWAMPEEYWPPFQFRCNVLGADVQQLINVNEGGNLQHQGSANSYVSMEFCYPTIAAWEREKDTHWFSMMRSLNGWRMGSTLASAYPQIYRRGDGWRYIKGVISSGTATADTFVAFSPQSEDDASLGGEIFVGRQLAGARWDVRGNTGLYGRVTGDATDFTLTGANFFCSKGESVLSVDPDYPHKSMQVWTPLAELNSWVDYFNTSEEYRDLEYFVDEFGIGHVRGVVNGAATTNDVFANLPAEVRPLKDHIYPAWKAGGGAGGVISRLNIRQNGDLEAFNTTNVGWFGFNGHWRVAT
jgi:hypothetical protein